MDTDAYDLGIYYRNRGLEFEDALHLYEKEYMDGGVLSDDEMEAFEAGWQDGEIRLK